jgi:hypothetical protein
MSSFEGSRDFDRVDGFDRRGFDPFCNPFFALDPCVCVPNGCCECECLCGFRFFERNGRLFRSRIF